MTMMMLISGDMLIYFASFSFMVCVCVVTYIFTVFGGWNIMKHHRPGEMSEMVNLQTSLTTTVSQRGKNRKLRLFWMNFQEESSCSGRVISKWQWFWKIGSVRTMAKWVGQWEAGFWATAISRVWCQFFQTVPGISIDVSLGWKEARSSCFCVDYIVTRGATSANFRQSAIEVSSWLHCQCTQVNLDYKGPKGCVWPWPWLYISASFILQYFASAFQIWVVFSPMIYHFLFCRMYILYIYILIYIYTY